MHAVIDIRKSYDTDRDFPWNQMKLEMTPYYIGGQNGNGGDKGTSSIKNLDFNSLKKHESTLTEVKLSINWAHMRQREALYIKHFIYLF